MLQRTLAFLFLCTPPYVFFSVGLLSWERFTGREDFSSLLAGYGVMGSLVLLVYLFHKRIWLLLVKLRIALEPIESFKALLIIIVIGIAVRMLWVFLFPAIPTSDEKTYIELASKLAKGDEYYIAGTYSYWPPGYPLFLSVIFRLFGSSGATIFWMNIIFYLCGTLIIYTFVRHLTTHVEAMVATALLAVWPAYFTLIGFPSKEGLLIFLVPLALLMYVKSSQTDHLFNSASLALGSGIAFGAASMIQPSLQLLLLAPIVGSVITNVNLRVILRSSVFLVIGMLLVILPWTIRNYYIHGQFIFISTNGGGGLYMSNNDYATGSYDSQSRLIMKLKQFDDLGELESNRVGFHEGVQWIKENPDRFLTLAVRKHLLFLGDDAGGVYGTLKRGLNISDWRYPLLKMVANFFWVSVWALMLIALLRKDALIILNDLGPTILILSSFYLLAIHSIFESASKYHLPLLGVYAILFSILAFTPERKGVQGSIL